MLKVLEDCVYSLYQARRYNVFLKKKKFRSNLVFKVSPLSVGDLKSQHFFLPREKN